MDSEKPAHVLVVEDDRALSKLFAVWLVMAGYTVTVSHTGLKGIRWACELVPDVIVWDVGLPDGDDIEWMRDGLPQVPMVFVTGHRHIAAKDGSVVLQKPVAEGIFLDAIEAALLSKQG